MTASAPNTDFKPYLSVVLAARNDSDAALKRLAQGVAAWIAQAKRTGLEIEILVVEWNPPADRPPLEKCLPTGADKCLVGIITVSPEVHQACPAGDKSDFFEHLALNVGLARARGQFLLATRPGVLPSSEMADFLAGRGLQPSTLYRCDSWEIDLPEGAGSASACVEPENMRLLRIHRRRETLDFDKGKVVLHFQRPLAVWWESLNPILNFSIFFIDMLGEFAKQVFHRLRGGDGRGCAGYAAEGRLLLRKALCTPVFILNKGRYQFRARRNAWLYFKPHHVNACGDFLLMERELWQRLRGFPEFQGDSRNVDVVFFLGVLSANDARERVLSWPLRVFRISGGESDGACSHDVPAMDYFAAVKMADERSQQPRPGPFNGEEWGLAGLMLRERFLKALS